MKLSRKQLNKYQEYQALRLKKANEDILKDSLTNSLLGRAGELPDYFKTWIDGSKLIAVIPALPAGDKNSQTYYSVGSLKSPEGNDSSTLSSVRISPVFMYVNEDFIEDNELGADKKKRFFLFDSEYSKLYKNEKKPHSKEYISVKSDTYDSMKEHLIAHPVVLFFQGCDDGHVGLRFKTEIAAFEYLQAMDKFEDIFDDKPEHHN